MACTGLAAHVDGASDQMTLTPQVCLGIALPFSRLPQTPLTDQLITKYPQFAVMTSARLPVAYASELLLVLRMRLNYHIVAPTLLPISRVCR